MTTARAFESVLTFTDTEGWLSAIMRKLCAGLPRDTRDNRVCKHRYLHITGGIYIPRWYLYIPGGIYISPEAFIYPQWRLYIPSGIYISPEAFIYTRQYLYIPRGIYISPAVFIFPSGIYISPAVLTLLQPQLFWTVISPFHSPKTLFWLLSRSATH